LFPLIYPRR